jgi:hypothetical protein
LRAFLQAQRVKRKFGPGEFEAFEGALHERVMGLERELLAAEIASSDVDAEAIVIAGEVHRRKLSARWEADRERFEVTLREAMVIPEEAVSVAVSLDGVLAPMEETDPVATRTRAAEEPRICKGPVGYKEVGVRRYPFVTRRATCWRRFGSRVIRSPRRKS